MSELLERVRLVLPKCIVDGDQLDASKEVAETDELLVSLCDVLREEKSISRLLLSSNMIGDGGLHALCDVLKANPCITHLDCSLNPFSSKQLSRLCSAIAKSHICELVLDDIDIQVKQVSLLSKLARSKTLRTLSLRRNALGDEGLRHLLVALMKAKSLCSLDVSENLITGKSLPIIAEFLEECPSVKEINLSGYTMQLEQAEAFRKLSELSECSLLVSVESLDVRLGELRKGAEEGLGVLLGVCGEVVQSCGESSQCCEEPLSYNSDKPSQNPPQHTPDTPTNSLAEPVHSIQAYLAKLPPEEAENDPILSSLVAALPELLRFLKTPSEYQSVGETVTVTIPAVIPSTVGPIERFGCNRLRVVDLLTTMTRGKTETVVNAVNALRLPCEVLRLMRRFRWNSALHGACVKFLESCVEAKCILGDRFAKEVAEMVEESSEEAVGYVEYLERVREFVE